MCAWGCMGAAALALLAGAEADLWLLWHWSQPRRSAPGVADARLRARPWQPVDAALLLAVIVLSALPALSRALHPETAEATPSATSLILMGLLGYAVIGAALALVVWRTGAGAGILFGERARLAADLRAGVLYGLATTPPVLLVSWGVAALMQSCGLSAPEQAVFDWLGDPTLPVSARIFLVAVPTLAFTGRRLTFQRRRATLWAWLIVFPNCGPLPQTSHT